MKLHHKAAAAVLSAGLMLGSTSVVAAGAANAEAASCAPQDQAAGSATANDATAAKHLAKVKKKRKQAKKAYKKHHTAANKKKLKKAKKKYRKALANLHKRNAAKASAIAAANACHAANPGTPGTSTSGAGALVSPTAIDQQVTGLLTGLGLPADQLAPLVSALDAVLTPVDGLTQGQLSDVLGQVSALLQSGQDGLDAAALTDALNQGAAALTQAGLPADQLLAPVEGLLSGLAGSGLSADALNDIAGQLASGLGDAGLTDGQVSQVVGQVLGQLGLNTQPTDPTELLSVVDGTLKTVVGDLGLDTAVTPAALDSLVNGLQGTLDDLSTGGGLLSGLTPITGGILGLI